MRIILLYTLYQGKKVLKLVKIVETSNFKSIT